jgi:hypothetical protein
MLSSGGNEKFRFLSSAGFFYDVVYTTTAVLKFTVVCAKYLRLSDPKTAYLFTIYYNFISNL